jgi:hypothetical protein
MFLGYLIWLPVREQDMNDGWMSLPQDETDEEHQHGTQLQAYDIEN